MDGYIQPFNLGKPGSAPSMPSWFLASREDCVVDASGAKTPRCQCSFEDGFYLNHLISCRHEVFFILSALSLVLSGVESPMHPQNSNRANNCRTSLYPCHIHSRGKWSCYLDGILWLLSIFWWTSKAFIVNTIMRLWISSLSSDEELGSFRVSVNKHISKLHGRTRFQDKCIIHRTNCYEISLCILFPISCQSSAISLVAIQSKDRTEDQADHSTTIQPRILILYAMPPSIIPDGMVQDLLDFIREAVPVIYEASIELLVLILENCPATSDVAKSHGRWIHINIMRQLLPLGEEERKEWVIDLFGGKNYTAELFGETMIEVS